MKRLSIILFVVVALFALVSCSSGKELGAAKTVEKAFKLIGEGNGVEVAKYYKDPAVKNRFANTLDNPFEGTLLQRLFKDMKMELITEEVKDAEATVEYKLTAVTNEEYMALTKMLQEQLANLGSDTPKEEIKAAVIKALDAKDWKNLEREERISVFTLVKEDGRLIVNQKDKQ